jgi:site-specific recombinase XerD
LGKKCNYKQNKGSKITSTLPNARPVSIDYTIASLQEKHPEMKKWRYHDLRHSFSYNFLLKGGEMHALKAILGHKSIQLTVDLYGNFKACDVDMVAPYEV